MAKSANGAEIDRQAVIRDVVQRLVDYYHPLRIYLFGSEARGEARLDSDLDFLVVLPDEAPRESWLDGGVYARLRHLPLAIDVLTERSTNFERTRTWRMSIPAIALREGQVIYDAAPHAP